MQRNVTGSAAAVEAVAQAVTQAWASPNQNLRGLARTMRR